MITTEPTTQVPAAPREGPACPPFAAMLAETVPIVCAIAVAGPPVVFLAVPWVLLGLLVAGPFALLLTAALATALVTAIAAIQGGPDVHVAA